MDSNRSLHPSVQKFKQFVQLHPLIINEVREGKKTWQDFYEEWVILGENHENWEQYKLEGKDENIERQTAEEEKKEAANEEKSSGQSSEVLTHLVGLIKNMNFDDIQRHMSQLNGLLSNVQQLIGIFQGGAKQNQMHQPHEQPHDPFSFRGF